MLFSDSLLPYTKQLSPEVIKAIEEIKLYFKDLNLKILAWDLYNIVIATEYNVSLPSRGSINNTIRTKEPVLIKISLDYYPDKSPLILSNRKDFPKSSLSHLYYSQKNQPAALCLVRDNLDEWFATVTISGFLSIGQQWFYKAATGTLNNDNNEFDPTRLDEFGKHIFKYDTLNEIVKNNHRFVDKFPMAVLLSCVDITESNSENFFLKTIYSVPFILIDKLKIILKQVTTKSEHKDVYPIYSLLIWNSSQQEEANYTTNLPTNYGELKFYLSIRDIDIDEILNSLKACNITNNIIIPIIYAVLRPKKVIGYNGKYEFFTFTLIISNKKLTDETLVIISGHAEPFSKSLAINMTNENRDTNNLFVGAGSLGSKIILHEARTGNLNIGIIDPDKLEQHNIARHGLFTSSIGENKAIALVKVIKDFFVLDSNNNFKAYEYSIIKIDQKEFENYQAIIDTTASLQVLNHLVLRKIPENLKYTRCEIADDGELGLLYSEGIDRNPRMDDLINLTFFNALIDSNIKQWRRNDAEKEITTVNIGLGCSSTTTIMPDDVISFHASSFSRIIQDDSKRQVTNGKGLIHLNINTTKSGFPNISNRSYIVEPFEILDCENKSGWQLRLLNGVSERLLNECKTHNPDETGGILIGVANYKTKVIHIFNIITQTEDSVVSPVSFTRGIRKLPEIINDIKIKTGEVIGYIGEWHTHPMNLETLSSTDLKTVEKLKEINSLTPIPTCTIVVTQRKILPFVFE